MNQQARRDLERVYRVGLRALQVGHASHGHTIRAIVGQDVFLNIVRNLGSILALSANFEKSTTKRYLPDAPSLASLTRKLVETYETLYYLCLEPVPPPEREFRELAYSLHHTFERASVEAAFGTKQSDNDDGLWDMVRISDIMHLRQNCFFQALSTKHQQLVLAGRAPFLRNGEVWKRRARTEWLRGAYKLFSNPIHGTALGVALAQNRGPGLLSSTMWRISAFRSRRSSAP